MTGNPVQDVLRVAAGELGVQEAPAHSNSGPRVRTYQAATFLGGTGWPWCAAFCHWVFVQARLPFPYRSASAFGTLDWARAHGWDIPVPKPGALGVVSAGAGHICIVERVDGQLVHSIDGNVSDSVARRVRRVEEFRGFIWHPKLDAKPVVVPPVKLPWWEVTTSINGHKKVVFRGPAAKVQKRLPGWLREYRLGVTIKRGRK